MGQMILVILIVLAVVVVMALKISRIIKEKDASGCPFCDGNCSRGNDETSTCQCNEEEKK